MSEEEGETETPGKTDEDLRQIAVDIHDGKIFTTNHLPREDVNLVPLVFMPLAFMGQDQLEQMQDVSLIYEYIDKAGPRSVNGYPAFMSMQALRHEEAERMWKFYESYKTMKDQFMGGQALE